ncbi:histidinol dehydrogenase [Verrucomicrobiales bacterium]|nr:histidinol dehydrogenase [Verrucomicrobiales bacterium]
MQQLRFNDPGFQKKVAQVFSRDAEPNDTLKSKVSEIIESIKKGKDKAISNFTKSFDGVDIAPSKFRVNESDLLCAVKEVSSQTKRAIKLSQRNVQKFATASRRKNWKMLNEQGVSVGEIYQPYSRVGIYIPGGSAPLVSTVLMTVAIAKAAKVNEIVVCTPPGKNGKICSELLYALQQCGATSIYRVGGVQAIAAMALGTKTIPKVDKIFGPGNSFVVEAKRQLFGSVSIDLLPGPSEILVLSDSSGRADFIASDLLAQAEHGGDSQIAFVTTSSKLLESVKEQLNTQSKLLSRQKQIKEVLEKGTTLVLVGSLNQGIQLANNFAPEHLSLLVKKPKVVIPKLNTSGAIFVGPYSAVAIGDFIAGPSHTLPTGGGGKSFSGLTVDMFQRRTSIVEVSKDSLNKSVESVKVFSEIEGLDAHGESVLLRRTD